MNLPESEHAPLMSREEFEDWHHRLRWGPPASDAYFDWPVEIMQALFEVWPDLRDLFGKVDHHPFYVKEPMWGDEYPYVQFFIELERGVCQYHRLNLETGELQETDENYESW